MASSVTVSDNLNAVVTKKGRSKKAALKDKKPSANEANILAGNQSCDAVMDIPVLVPELEKENIVEKEKKLKSKGKGKGKGKQEEVVVEKAVDDDNDDEFNDDIVLEQADEMVEIVEKNEKKTRGKAKGKQEPAVEKPCDDDYHVPEQVDEMVEKKGKKTRGKTKGKQEVVVEKASDDDNIVEEEIAEEIVEKAEKKEKKVKGKAEGKGKEEETVAKASDFEKQLQEMQEMMEKMKIEKAKTEEILKEKDAILKKKDEEIKMLHKIKEFKPTVTLPIIQSMKDKVSDKQDKKKKDCPDRKRPASAYALWYKDMYNEVKKENPDADFKEISNIMGTRWRGLSPEEKKPYEDQYKSDKEAYLKVVGIEKRESEAMKLLEEERKQKTAMELYDQYQQFVQEADNKGNKKSKKDKDPLKPKHPVGAYFLYSNERRRALLAEGKKFIEASKVISEEWKNMTEEQKKPYEEIGKINKEKYHEEMEVYKQNKEAETAILKKEEEELMKVDKVEALQLLKKKEKTENIMKQTKDLKKKQKEVKVVDPNKPKRPTSSYFMFSKEERKKMLKEKPDINHSTLTGMISLKWKELSEDDKKIWNEKAAVFMDAYKKELEEYNTQKQAGALSAEAEESSSSC